MSDRSLIFRIYKEFKPEKATRKKNDPFKKWAWDQNTKFSKEGKRMAKKYFLKYSLSLASIEI